LDQNFPNFSFKKQNLLDLIGVPMDVGAGCRGMGFAPEALRIAGLARMLEDLGCRVTDFGDLSGPRRPETAIGDGLRHLEEVAAWCRAVRDKVEQVLVSGHLPIVLGGDHSLSIGSIAGVARHCARSHTPLSVLWIDAHADFNTPHSSPSGNIHGMPVAALCGMLDVPELTLGPGPGATVASEDVYLLGVRALDREEKAAAVASGLNVHDMRQIDEQGMAPVLRGILERIAARNGHLHVSFDLDFLDPAVAPGVGTPVPGGATWREAHLCMEMIHESGLMGSLDLVELNPYLDIRATSVELMVNLASSLFGKHIIQRGAGSTPLTSRLEAQS